MIENRIARRTEVRLDAAVETVISSGPAAITDLSEGGAKLLYPGVSQGDRVTIVALGQVVTGTVAWADPDRFGMRFDQALSSGPLHGLLRQLLGPRVVATRAAGTRPVFGRKAA